MGGAKKISVSELLTRSGLRWQVRHLDVALNRIRRPCFGSRREAEAFADALRNQNRDALGAFAVLAPEVQALLMTVWREAKLRGVDMMAAVVRGGRGGETVPDAGKVVQQLIVLKREQGRHVRYVRGLENFLAGFIAGREPMPVSAFSLRDVEAYIGRFNPVSRSTARARLSSFFNFAVRQGWRPDNPCQRLEPFKVTLNLPRVFSLAEARSAMAFIKSVCPRMGPWFVLSTFCGLRPEEAMKSVPADFHFEEGWVTVAAQSSKVRQRRVVYPRPEAMRLLQRSLKLYPKVCLTEMERKMDRAALRDHLGWKFYHKDVSRHTAASMWLAVEPDVAKVAAMLGNSPAVLLKHYKALVTQKEAAKFWRLTF